MTGSANVIAHLEQSFAELDQSTQREISGAAATAAAFAGLGATLKVFEVGLSGTAAGLARFVPVLGMLSALPWVAELAVGAGKKAQDYFGNKETIGTVPGIGWVPGMEPNFPHYSVDDVHRALGMPAAEVKGSAELSVNVQVEPSDSFVSRIVSALRNDINAFGGGAGSAGSTGLSMPEVAPPY
jgi:hypothetical protein